MAEIFVSFVGKRDPFADDEKKYDGPILTCLSSGHFRNLEKVILFHTRDDFMKKRAEKTAVELLRRWNLDSEIHEISVEDPTDLLEIYRELRLFFLKRTRDFRGKNFRFFLSSGTPQMQICFFLIAGSGEIPGSLVYQPDPRYGKGVREVSLNYEEFPRISPPRTYVSLTEVPPLSEEILREAEELGIFIGTSVSFRKTLTELYAFSRDCKSVLLYGETGTGKDLLAKLYHRLSPRRDKPFIPVNVATLPDTLFESELLGSFHRCRS